MTDTISTFGSSLGGVQTPTDTLIGKLKCTDATTYAAYDTEPTYGVAQHTDTERYYCAVATSVDAGGIPTNIQKINGPDGLRTKTYPSAKMALDALYRHALRDDQVNNISVGQT